ncbi:MAG: photosystem reaction center subunit H [Bacillaceae bacterium]|nr:photosystem reaction center subunit H [Bacillaceae bacterium]
MGDFAVTIESEMNIIDLTEIPIANSLVSKNIKITGARVMSKKGHLIGKVTEYFINDDNGAIIAINVDHNGGTEAVLAAEYVTTFGKDIIIVNEESEKQFVSSIEKLLNPEAIEANLEHQSEVAADTEVVVEEAKDLESLLERQIALLVGKKVTSPIFNRDDQLLIAEGTILTRDLILSVHEDGPSGMVELSMNVETI